MGAICLHYLVQGKASKRLDMLRWNAAYQCFAIAADAAEVRVVPLVKHASCVSFVEVWTYQAALAHWRVCLQVAGMAHTLLMC